MGFVSSIGMLKKTLILPLAVLATAIQWDLHDTDQNSCSKTNINKYDLINIKMALLEITRNFRAAAWYYA